MYKIKWILRTSTTQYNCTLYLVLPSRAHRVCSTNVLSTLYTCISLHCTRYSSTPVPGTIVRNIPTSLQVDFVCRLFYKWAFTAIIWTLNPFFWVRIPMEMCSGVYMYMFCTGLPGTAVQYLLTVPAFSDSEISVNVYQSKLTLSRPNFERLAWRVRRFGRAERRLLLRCASCLSR